MAQANDYYSLLGVTTDASKDELSRARRELTAKLHPDHFTGNPEQQTKYAINPQVILIVHINIICNGTMNTIFRTLVCFERLLGSK